MEDHADAADDGAGTLRIKDLSLHQIYSYCETNKPESIIARVHPNKLGAAAKRRIADYCLKGVFGPGFGEDTIEFLTAAYGPMTYMKVVSRSRELPGRGSKLRPYFLFIHYATDELVQAAREYNASDIARWKLLFPSDPSYGLTTGPTENHVDADRQIRMAVSGFHSLAEISKFFSPVIMNEERKQKGAEVYKRFQALHTIELLG